MQTERRVIALAGWLAAAGPVPARLLWPPAACSALPGARSAFLLVLHSGATDQLTGCLLPSAPSASPAPCLQVYMLHELEPAKELTGGPWYGPDSFDSEFIAVLQEVGGRAGGWRVAGCCVYGCMQQGGQAAGK